MKLFFYYLFHSAKNALKKLFKTWVLLFFVIMLGGGLILGATIGTLLKKSGAADNIGEAAAEQQENATPMTEEDRAEVRQVIELAAGGIILLVFVINVLGADKKGADIFQPADVNLLFASPMKPQSVLLFRTVTQMGVSLLASVYLLYQIPNLMRQGLDTFSALAVIFGWALTLCTAQLLKMFCFVAASTRPAVKANLRRIVYGLLLFLTGAFALYKQQSGLGWWEAVKRFFNAPVSRWIPVWGWIKGFVVFAVDKERGNMLLCLLLLILAGTGLAWLIWHMKADFYEEALIKASEKAEMMATLKDSDKGAVMKRKKDRSERLRRNEFSRGSGANVFFWKAVYNRFRFAHLGVFTRTMEFYLAMALGTAVLCRFVIETESSYPIILLLAAAVFFRSLGNALREDTRMWFFQLIPENAWVKLCWSLAGDLMNCLLDVLPPMLLGLLLQGAPLGPAFLWLPAILSVTAYATAVGTFIDLSVNVNAGSTLKQMLQVMFIYFGLLPDILIVGILLLMKLPLPAALAVTVINFGLAALFLYFASLLFGRNK